MLDPRAPTNPERPQPRDLLALEDRIAELDARQRFVTRRPRSKDPQRSTVTESVHCLELMDVGEGGGTSDQRLPVPPDVLGRVEASSKLAQDDSG